MTTPKFFPRPEAHPMQWATLMPPIKRAVRDLLVLIEGATSKEINKEGALANCFLISVSGGGASGAEKTVAETQNQALLADAQHSAEKARNIIWLDVLDL